MKYAASISIDHCLITRNNAVNQTSVRLCNQRIKSGMLVEIDDAINLNASSLPFTRVI